MGDLNRDLRIVWERDYSHLISETESIIGKRSCFIYGDYEIYLASIYNSLFVINQCSGELSVEIDIEELKSNYFLDILNPSKNELVLFELEYGFEWPFQEKNKKINIKENKYE